MINRFNYSRYGLLVVRFIDKQRSLIRHFTLVFCAYTFILCESNEVVATVSGVEVSDLSNSFI